MADKIRFGEAVWKGDLRSGQGTLGTESGVLRNVPYNFGTRFGDAKGTNPEELIGAAHAACYSMAFSNVLASKGFTVNKVETRATVTGTFRPEGFRIIKVELDTRGEIPNITPEKFQELAREGEKGCPVSNLLRPGVEIVLTATLVGG
jgi:osmotically inducible protein OsmC